MISRITYDKVVAKLNEFSSWVKNTLSIDPHQNSRFCKLIDNMKLLETHYREQTLQTLIDSMGNEILWYSLIDSRSFNDIFWLLKGLDKNILPRDKIELSLNGPFLGKEEIKSTANVHPRNTLFELETAAFIHRMGADIIGFDDVEFRYENQEYVVECKRVFTDTKIESKIRQAQKKLGGKNTGNIVSLSLEKLLQADEKILICKDESDIPVFTKKLVDDFITKHKMKWQQLYANNIIALVLALPFAARVLDIQLLVSGWEWCILPLVPPKSNDAFEKLKKLTSNPSLQLAGESGGSQTVS